MRRRWKRLPTPAQRALARRKRAAENRRIDAIAAALDAYDARGGPMAPDVFEECCARVGVKL